MTGPLSTSHQSASAPPASGSYLGSSARFDDAGRSLHSVRRAGCNPAPLTLGLVSSNRLIDEKSPYLLQHAHNPVDWYPWGEEAFEKARQEDKPIFLSIGYSTCHWCHVMERESFENEDVARILNRALRADQSGPRRAARRGPRLHAVRAGVHRQRRMAHVGVADAGTQAVFRRDLFSARQSLRTARDSARFSRGSRRRGSEDRAKIEESGAQVLEQLRAIQPAERAAAGARCGQNALDSAFYAFRRSFDARLGGFGGAPKFPRPSVLNFLLRYCAATEMRKRSTWCW